MKPIIYTEAQRLKDIEAELREKSTAELNQMVAQLTGVHLDYCQGGAFELLRRENDYTEFRRVFAWTETDKKRGYERIFSCRFSAGIHMAMLDFDASLAIVYAFIFKELAWIYQAKRNSPFKDE